MNNELYEHQTELANNMYQSRFLYVYDDCFGRGLKNKEEIKDYCLEATNDIEVKITPISYNEENRINVFILDFIYKKPITHIEDFANENKLYGFINLSDCQYYKSYPCNFNLRKDLL